MRDSLDTMSRPNQTGPQERKKTQQQKPAETEPSKPPKRQGCPLCSGFFISRVDRDKHFEVCHPEADPSKEDQDLKERHEKSKAEGEKIRMEEQRQEAAAKEQRAKKDKARRKRQVQNYLREKRKEWENWLERRQEYIFDKTEDPVEREVHARYFAYKEDYFRKHGFGEESEKPKPAPKSSHARSNHHHTLGFLARSNHYHTLGIHSWSSEADIARAAKSVRIACHPDKLKRQRGLTQAQQDEIDENAKRVGGAADILTDPTAKAVYDSKLRCCCC